VGGCFRHRASQSEVQMGGFNTVAALARTNGSVSVLVWMGIAFVLGRGKGWTQLESWADTMTDSCFQGSRRGGGDKQERCRFGFSARHKPRDLHTILG
jgi:hypothetical protein